jgi:transcriptional regulator with XRE-family HTH domain
VEYGAHWLDHQEVPNASRHKQDAALISVGDAIRRVRLANGVSQEQLALTAGVYRSYVGRVERGDNNVALLTLIRIATALGMTASMLLADAGL